MSAFKGSKFDERRAASAEAKKALLERFKAKPPPDDPAVLARQAEMKAVEEAREVRAAQRRVAKAAELERLAEAERERQREIEAAAVAEVARLAEVAAAKRRLEIEQKAARDARYAARKARR